MVAQALAGAGSDRRRSAFGPSVRTPLALLALAVFAVALHAPAFVVSDSDGYYHLRHAWLYRELGLGYAGFPWMQRSAIRTYASDLWYGFHVLLLPFTLHADLVLGLRVGAVAVTIASLWVFYGALRRLAAALPELWTIVLGTASADLALRLTMLRPHSLSLTLAVALFAFLVPQVAGDRKEALRRDQAGTAMLAFLLAWIHLALAWSAVVVLCAVGSAGWLLRRRTVPRGTVLALFAGLALGALLRPAPFGGLQLAWLQLFGSPGPQQGSFEMAPLTLELFLLQLVPVTALVLVAATLGWGFRDAEGRARARDSLAIGQGSSLALALGFLALAFVGARRASDFFVAFSVLFVALRVTAEVEQRTARRSGAGWRLGVASAAALAGAVVIVVAAGRSWPLLRFYQQFLAEPFSPERLREPSAWLAKHSRPGEIVFHVDWERFAPLFFWNPRNYYIHGMDPRFEYAYDPALSRAHQFLVADDIFAFATEESRRAHDLPRTLRQTLTEGFGASYVVLEKRRSPRFIAVLRDIFGMAPVFENDEAAVFALGEARPGAAAEGGPTRPEGEGDGGAERGAGLSGP